jgi:hypothetical protein
MGVEEKYTERQGVALISPYLLWFEAPGAMLLKDPTLSPENGDKDGAPTG